MINTATARPRRAQRPQPGPKDVTRGARTLALAFVAGLGLTASPRPARADGYQDARVQVPRLDPPDRGSVSGGLSDFAPTSAQVARGLVEVPAPFVAPTERGPLLAEVFPSYVIEGGQSEWGLGWAAHLEVRRVRAIGDLDFTSDDFVSPWGRLIQGSDGAWYPQGLSERFRISREGAAWVAIGPDGTRYVFAATVAAPRGVYAWALTEARSALGDETRLTYEANDSGRLFLTRVEYGGRDGAAQMRIDLRYEAAPAVVVDRRAGAPLRLDRRVRAVEVLARAGGTGNFVPRFRYELVHTPGTTGPAWYLTSVQKVYPSGAAEPATTYQYDLGDSRLRTAEFERYPGLDDIVRRAGIDALLPEHSALVDVDEDGRLDFEHALRQVLIHHTDAGWVVERLPPPTGAEDPDCRPLPAPFDPPRTLVRMTASPGEPHVVVTSEIGLANASRIKVCRRDGTKLLDQGVAGLWSFGPNTRLVDLDRDRRPDLVQVYQGGYRFLRNTSTDEALSFAPAEVRSLDLRVQPEATYLVDVDGDGVVDLVARDHQGLIVFHGLGGLAFTPEPEPLQLFAGQDLRILAPSDQLIFADVNKDGLADVLVTSGAQVGLYTNRGDRLLRVEVPALDRVDWRAVAPVLADLTGRGDVEVTQLQEDAIVVLALSTPGTGLLQRADDGKGTVATFSYARAAAATQLGHRPVLIDAITVDTAGRAPVTYRYGYRGPVLHPTARFLLGYSTTTRTLPRAVDETSFHHEDGLGSPIVGRRLIETDTGLVRTSSPAYEARSYLGVPWWRPTRAVTRTGAGGEAVTRTVTFARYDREFCPAEIDTDAGHGVLARTTTFADVPALAGALACVAREIITRGDGPSPFTHAAEFSRNDLGQVTEVDLVAPDARWTLQRIEYDGQHRMTTVTAPGAAPTRLGRDPATGALIGVTGSDDVAVTAARDPITDAVAALDLDRGGPSPWRRSYAYDDLERLASTWDDAGASSPTSPRQGWTYRYAASGTPAAIVTRALTDAASPGPIVRQDLELLTGAGARIARGARIPEGWAIGTYEQVDPGTGEARTSIREPLPAQGDLRMADLEDGALELAWRRLADQDTPVAERTVIQDGVTRERQHAYAIEGGAQVRISATNGARSERTAIDADGHVLWFEDGGGHRTRFEYDALGRLVRVLLPGGAAHAVAYDAFGRIARVTRDGVGAIAYAYDPVSGRVAGKEFRAPSGRAERRSTWTYDQAGRITRAAHRLEDDGGDGANAEYAYRYDGEPPPPPGGAAGGGAGERGLLTAVEGPGFAKALRHDRRGRVIERTLRLTGWRTLRETIAYFEDDTERGRTWTVSDTSGAVLESFEEDRTLDAFGRVAALRLDGQVFASLEYDGGGRLAAVRFSPGGESFAVRYDAATWQPDGLDWRTATWTGALGWELDRFGQVARETLTVGGAAEQATYGYDGRGFLTSAAWASVQDAYAYDADGLRYRPAAGGRLAAAGATYRFDDLGRVVARDDLELAYGPAGDLAVARRGAHEWRFVDDELGERILKLEDGQPVRAFAGGAVLDGAGLVVPVRVGGHLLGVVNRGGFHLVAADARGTLRLADGQRAEASPYGVRAERPPIARAIDYAASGYDADLGAIRMGVRDYDPALGQFWTPDPLFLEQVNRCASSPLECNLYSYARNDPLGRVDPAGTCSAPAGMSGDGDVGLCIEAFIAAPTVGTFGLGDDRGFSGDDPSLGARLRIDVVVDPPSGTVESKTTVAVSELRYIGVGAQGTANVGVSGGIQREDGSVSFTVKFEALNGIASTLRSALPAPIYTLVMPDRLQETIDGELSFTVDARGGVHLDGGQVDGYPSLGVYSYHSATSGEAEPIFESAEGDLSQLADPTDVQVPALEPGAYQFHGP